MGFFKNIIDRIRGTYTLETPWPHLADLSVNLPSASLTVPGIDRPAENVVGVFAAVKARQECISSVPLRVTDGQERVIENGPLVDLIESPNSWMDGVLYLSAIEAYLALYDFCLVAKVGDVGARPDELIPLNPRNLVEHYAVHKPTGLRFVAGWTHVDNGGGSSAPLLWEDVIPIYGFNPHAPFRGLSPVDAGRRTLLMDLATREQNLALQKGGALPSMVLETEHDLTPEQADEFKSKWDDKYAGFQNRHKTAILSNGLKAKPLGFSPSDLETWEGLRMGLKDVIMLMRVMPAMIGSMEGETGLSQGSSTASQKVAWWNQTGLGELARIAAAHQVHLVDKYAWTGSGRALRHHERDSKRQFDTRCRRAMSKGGGLSIWFDVNQIPELMEHRLQRIEMFSKLRLEGYRPNDINDFLDLGLPEHPTNQGVVSFNLLPVEELGATVLLDQNAPNKTEPARTAETLSALDRLEQAVTRHVCEERALATKYRNLKTVLARLQRKMEKATAKKVSRYFLEQRGRVLDRIGQRSARAAETRATLEEIFPLNDENAALQARFSPLFAEQMREAWEFMTVSEAGKKPEENPFEVNSPEIQEAINSRVIQAANMNETTEADLRKILAESFDAGESTAELADRIGEYYAKHIGDRAGRPMTAARTQTTGIVNDGRMAAARELGGLYKLWLHGSPDEAREHHVEAESRYSAGPIPLDQKFVLSNGVEMDAPGDSSAGIEEVANCTCMVGFTEPKNGE